MFYPNFGDADNKVEAPDRDEYFLRSSFETPLQFELQSRGLTPRNPFPSHFLYLREPRRTLGFELA